MKHTDDPVARSLPRSAAQQGWPTRLKSTLEDPSSGVGVGSFVQFSKSLVEPMRPQELSLTTSHISERASA